MVKIPVSIGELFDKITILELKKEYIENAESLVNVLHELTLLTKIATKLDAGFKKGSRYKKLARINSELWTIEDELRTLERMENIYGVDFITRARQVYISNDKRAAIKKAINKKYNSGITEVKSYPKY